MKNIFIIASLLFVIASCGAGKNASSASSTASSNETTVDNEEVKEADDKVDPTNSQNSDVLIASGVIKDKSADGCGFVIQMMVDENTVTSTFYEPLRLPQEYQEEGKLIRIEYRMSRRPSTCTLAIPIIIDKILTN